MYEGDKQNDMITVQDKHNYNNVSLLNAETIDGCWLVFVFDYDLLCVKCVTFILDCST